MEAPVAKKLPPVAKGNAGPSSVRAGNKRKRVESEVDEEEERDVGDEVSERIKMARLSRLRTELLCTRDWIRHLENVAAGLEEQIREIEMMYK